MSRTVSLIQQAHIASPCDMKWQDMTGDDRKRFCGKCQLHVYNFRNMSEAEADEIIRSASGRLCGQLWRRADGTILTRDCPVGVSRIRWRMCMATAKIAAAVIMRWTAIGYGRARDDDGSDRWQSAYGRTVERIDCWLNGPAPQVMSGVMCVPPLSGSQSGADDR